MQEVMIMTPKQQAYETLAKTMIKKFEKRIKNNLHFKKRCDIIKS